MKASTTLPQKHDVTPTAKGLHDPFAPGRHTDRVIRIARELRRFAGGTVAESRAVARDMMFGLWLRESVRAAEATA